MRVRRTVLITSAVLALGAGGAAAVAATSGDDGKKAEDAVLADAAKRLNVSPEALRSALGAAEDAQLDQAVKDGKLTQEQADAIKQRRQQSGRVLGHGPGGPGGPGFGHGPGGPGFGPGGPGLRGGILGAGLDAAAQELGLTRAQLLGQLRGGKSLADVAKAKGKTASDVEAAIKAAVTKQLDADVAAKRLTDAQRDHVVSELDEHLDELVTRSFDEPRGPRFGGRFRHHG
jgi:hypothetical protein